MENNRIEIKGFNIFDQWIYNLRLGKTIEFFFIDNLYKNIAIYGMGRIGMQMLEELKNSSVSVKYGIDKNAKEMFFDDIEMIEPNKIKEIKDIDAIVVTPVHLFNEIESYILQLGCDIDVISIEQVVDYIYRVHK